MTIRIRIIYDFPMKHDRIFTHTYYKLTSSHSFRSQKIKRHRAYENDQNTRKILLNSAPLSLALNILKRHHSSRTHSRIFIQH